MAKESLVAKMEKPIQGNGKMEKNMGMENTIGLMIVHMKENICRIPDMEKEK